ncbi:DUF3105 domain-containing protein [Microbacterium sp. NPDC076911]|uniref:DUF3105 domain-containing protein n=1 Tax=Microbacterium sp. NPDC076911 TaxID=3154958 RepID=UPI00343D2084
MSSKSSSSPNKRQSGNPAKQADINLSVKQQREAKRQEKLAEYQRQMAKRKRSKLVWWIVGATGALAVVALVAASVVFAPDPPQSYEAGSEGVEIAGVEEFAHTTTHVEGIVDYDQSPPAGGEHNSIWLNCGVYSEAVPNENAVHSMEHGAVWVTYDPDVISGDDLESLKAELPSSYAILSPYPGIDSPIAVSGWNHQLKVDSVDDERIGEFFEEYWRSQNVPEPTAVCAGGLDAPGKES